MSVITSGYGRNTWNSGAWNRSVVDRTVTVTGVSLSTAVNSVDVTIPGTAFVTNVGITTAVGSTSVTANASLTLTGTSLSFGLNSPTVQLVKEVNVTGVALVTGLGSLTITSSPKVIPSQVVGTFSLGTPFIKAGIEVDVTGVSGEFDTGNESSQAGANPVIYNSRTFRVTVANPGSGNIYYIDGKPQYGLNLVKGRTLYTFDQSDSSNSGHPLRFYLDEGRTIPFTTNVQTVGTPGNAGAYTQIFVANDGPTTLYYQCSVHAGMGGKANFQPVIRTRVVSPNINGDGNLVLTGVSARFRTHIRGIWTPKVFGGTSEIWKAKKI